MISAGVVQIEWKAALFSFLPVSTNAYWFMTGYVVLYVFSPFINILIKNINKRLHLIIIVVVVIIACVLPFISDFHSVGIIAWFVLLYLTGAYIRKYPKLFSKSLPYFCVFAVFGIIGTALMVAKGIGIFQMTYPSTYISAVAVFVLFKNIKIKNSPVINLLSSATLGVYLIHDNLYVRPYLWSDICKIKEIILTNDFWWKAIVCVALIYVVCSTIELLRQGFFRLLDRFVDYNILSNKQGRSLKI